MDNLIVYKGDDTDGAFGRHLSITVQAPEGTSFTGCTADFTVNGIKKSWSSIVSGTPLDLAYTNAETSSMPVGAAKGVFRIIDANGYVRTLDNELPFIVTTDLNQVYPGSSNAGVDVGVIVKWTDIMGRPDFTAMDPDGATVADIVIKMQEAEQ